MSSARPPKGGHLRLRVSYLTAGVGRPRRPQPVLRVCRPASLLINNSYTQKSPRLYSPKTPGGLPWSWFRGRARPAVPYWDGSNSIPVPGCDLNRGGNRQHRKEDSVKLHQSPVPGPFYRSHIIRWRFAVGVEYSPSAIPSRGTPQYSTYVGSSEPEGPGTIPTGLEPKGILLQPALGVGAAE